MLEKDPEERYATARDLLVDLRRLRKQSETGLLLPPRNLVLRRNKKRMLWGSVVSGLVLVAMIVPCRSLLRQLQNTFAPSDNAQIAIPNLQLLPILPFRAIAASPQVRTLYICLAHTIIP